MATATPNVPDPEARNKSKLVVAAIDFGTTYTGYAFSFLSDPTNVLMSKWSGNNIRASTERAPTCVLMSPDKKFLAFGYEAEDTLKSMIEEERETHEEGSGNNLKATDHYYFEKFKMKLYQTKKLRLGTMLADKYGKELPAIDVFATVIGHLKDRILTELESRVAGFQEDDILWVLTVPAIWSDSAKQFMSKAAEKAELGSDVKLILEPEAASLFCNQQKLCRIAKVDDSVCVETFPVGQKYIVADLGGGTADLSVHEILPDRNLREIHRADGDALGGIMVDQEFFIFLEQILGAEIYERLKLNYMDAFLDMHLEFETKKRNFKPEEPGPTKVRLPIWALKEIIKDLGEESLKTKIAKACERYGEGSLALMASSLCIGKEIMKSFFEKVTDGINSFINKMRENDELGEINLLLMVGGFSESTYVQKSVQSQIEGIRIIVPADPSLAVLKGAVFSGHNPKAITERIARYTYGFSFARVFKPGEDPEELKVIRNGRELCTSVFDKLITKGDVLKVGDHFGTPCAHITTSEELDLFSIISKILPLVADVYRSEEKDPKYSEEEYGCEMIGLMLIPPPPGGWPPFSILVQELVVGEAEFTLWAVNFNTMQVVEGKLDFLSSSQEN